MYKHLLSVGGITILSRGTGFLRDVAVSAMLGTGVIADAFVVAFRLPNNFRQIFGEGAFNTAYVPSYSQVLETEGRGEAKTFASQIFTILLLSQIVLLALALLFTRELVRLLAPGFENDPVKMDHAVNMTRITFPYLLCMTLVTLQSGTLNANRRFIAAAFAPVLLNVVMILFLGIAFLFPDAGVAASVGVSVSGVLQLILMIIAAQRAGVLERLARPRWTHDVRRFFRMLGPAVIGSAGAQIAVFADTIISSLLPTGGPSSLYYAERIYQLPIGVIGIAAGTVLLPEMSRRLAQGNPEAALHAQNRTMALTLALSAPFFITFMLMPHEIMRGVFQRGQFTAEATAASAAVLAAYGIGLLPIVLIRSAVASFQARGDTTTPMVASLTALACNLGLKILLYQPMGAVGLATATAVGIWINLLILVALASMKGLMQMDETLARVAVAVDVASLLLGGFIVLAGPSIERFAAHLTPRGELPLLLVGAPAAALYGIGLLAALRLLDVKLPGRPKRPSKTRK
jgi:putative peptidoglycan lipid II flippase